MTTNYNFSIWEKESFVHYHHAIIGGGIVGLHTAIALKNKFPTHSVILLEKGLLPTGASTKNAGFACMGSATELLDDLSKSSPNEVLALFEMRRKGLADTRQLLGDDAIGYQANGSYELLNENDVHAIEKIEALNTFLSPLIQENAFTINNTIIAQNKFDINYFKTAIQNNLEGELHTGKLVKSLLHYAMHLGIEVRTGCNVSGIDEITNGVNIICNTSTEQAMVLRATTVCICTNAFTKQLLPNIDLEPGRGQVLVTKPIGNLAFKGIYHLEQGYYYFREINNRVLFGGGRNLDFDKEATTSFAINEAIINDLQFKLANYILPHTPHEIDYTWTGIMAFGNNTKTPIIQKYSPHIYLAVRCGGMGVAFGSEMGRQVAELINY
jgi:glycine/D-amino acid oxidase-like deaminating enzyme